MIGQATFEPHSGLAKKALALVIAGVAKRCKFTGAYFFTSSLDKSGKRKREIEEDEEDFNEDNPIGEALRKIVIDLVIAAETIAGVEIEAYVCDMGPDNMALWRAINIGCSANDKIVRCSILHPCRPDARLWFLPDTVHLYKNIIISLSSNKFTQLSDNVTQEAGLGNKVVELQHVQELLDHEKTFELKVAYRLKQDNIDCKKTFEKNESKQSCSCILQKNGGTPEINGEEEELHTIRRHHFLCRSRYLLVRSSH